MKIKPSIEVFVKITQVILLNTTHYFKFLGEGTNGFGCIIASLEFLQNRKNLEKEKSKFPFFHFFFGPNLP